MDVRVAITKLQKDCDLLRRTNSILRVELAGLLGESLDMINLTVPIPPRTNDPTGGQNIRTTDISTTDGGRIPAPIIPSYENPSYLHTDELRGRQAEKDRDLAKKELDRKSKELNDLKKRLEEEKVKVAEAESLLGLQAAATLSFSRANLEKEAQRLFVLAKQFITTSLQTIVRAGESDHFIWYVPFTSGKDVIKTFHYNDLSSKSNVFALTVAQVCEYFSSAIEGSSDFIHVHRVWTRQHYLKYVSFQLYKTTAASVGDTKPDFMTYEEEQREEDRHLLGSGFSM